MNGAMPHIALSTREFLKAAFGNRKTFRKVLVCVFPKLETGGLSPVANTEARHLYRITPVHINQTIDVRNQL